MPRSTLFGPPASLGEDEQDRERGADAGYSISILLMKKWVDRCSGLPR
ncbi:MAG: hypothetical protein H0W90_12600 [Actinobacteria bacterium]|nr:hypothetical protein [Actinomycetota bacterium]